jgi:hydroxymethylbilane synthase
MTNLIIGCRTSRLAVTQTRKAGDYIASRIPSLSYELREYVTSGDKITGNLKAAGGKGHFVKDVETSLLEHQINLAIHCLKDMPGNEAGDPNLVIAGYLPREDPSDVLICDQFPTLEALPRGAIVGTSSPRRAAQIRQVNPHISILDNFRGSIDTRMRKVAEGEVDATILAAAGLLRADNLEKLDKRLPLNVFLPAIGQGTLALQCRADDYDTLSACESVNDTDAAFASIAERTCLRQLDGDCYSAIAGLCSRDEDEWTLNAAVYGATDMQHVFACASAPTGTDPVALGTIVAERLLSKGAAELIGSFHRS